MPRNKAPPQCLIYKSHKNNPKIRKYKYYFKHLFVDDIMIDYFFPFSEVGVLYLELKFHQQHRHQLAERLKFTKSQPGGKRGNKLYVALICGNVVGFEREVCDLNIMVMEYGFDLVILQDFPDFVAFMNGLNQQVLSQVE